MKSCLRKNDIEMYSAHNGGKYVLVEMFIRTLKNKIYKRMTSASKNVYTDQLDDTVNKYNNTYYRAIKMEPVDAKSKLYIDFDKNSNREDPKFKVPDNVILLKYKNIFLKR